MAKAFVTVCTAMLSRGITVLEIGGDRMEFSPRDLRELTKKAEVYAAVNAGIAAGGRGVRHFDAGSYRT